MKTFNDPEAFARVKRLPAPVTLTTERLREATRARGVDVVDLSASAAADRAPEVVVEAFRAATTGTWGDLDAQSRGDARLRAAAAAWLQRRHAVQVDPEREVVVTRGVKDAIGAALIATLQEGDPVLAPAPATPLHANAALLAGGETIAVTVGPGVDFMESLFAASEKAERRPRGLVVSFPSDPTTAVATPELLAKIVRFAEARDLFILSDASWCELVFDGGPAPLLLQVPGARERTLEIVSLAASHDLGAYPVAFAFGNHALASAVARVRSYLQDGLSRPAEAAVATALERCDAVPAEVVARYRRRRDALVRYFGAAGWPVPSPAATAFAWAPIPEPLRHHGSLELCRRLVEEAGVAVSPGLAFGAAGEGHVRIALGEDEARIQLAAERVGAWMRKVAAEPRPSHTPVPRPPEHA